jgi:uncharacterized cupredoxin-like copper-binding protein
VVVVVTLVVALQTTAQRLLPMVRTSLSTALTVGQGQVTLAFNNTSGVNQHNWILANGGDDVAARIDEAALGAEGYIPTGADVLAHSRLLNPGENETVTFTAPAAGTYTYLCTVPGHYAAGMKGTLTVQ